MQNINKELRVFQPEQITRLGGALTTLKGVNPVLLLLLQLTLANPTCIASVCEKSGRAGEWKGCTSVEHFVNDPLCHCSFVLQGALQQ